MLIQGMGGVIAAVSNIMSIWMSSGPTDSGFGYFMTADIVVIGALVGYLCLPCFVSDNYNIFGGTSKYCYCLEATHHHCDGIPVQDEDPKISLLFS
jgi:hypothetical protein